MRILRFVASGLALVLVIAGCSSVALAQVVTLAEPTVAAGAPTWAKTAVNLEFHPIVGTTRIAYVDPTSGDDSTGAYDLYDAGDFNYRTNPDSAPAYATVDAAIADVGREGPHAILLANLDSGAVHTVAVVNGGCQGQDASHPYMFSTYWPSGTAGTTVESNMAMFDPGIGAHPGTTHMFSVQRSSGFSNLIIEGFIFKQAHRVWGDPAYDEIEAVDGDNDWGPIRVYGNSTNVLIRNCRAHSTAGGFDIEGIANADGSRLSNVVLDRVVALDVWDTNDRFEGLFMSYCDRPRILNSATIGCGWFRHNPTIDQGNEGTGTNQGDYLSFVKEPWMDNCILALNSHAGAQFRCGGTVTRSLFYANSRNLGFGHGQNEYETAAFLYDAAGRDILVWGAKDVGDESGLAIGEGIGWGRCRSLDIARVIVVGDPTYRPTDEAFAFNLGTTPGGTTVRIGSVAIYDWNPTGVSTGGSFGWQSGSSTGATVSITGVRVYEKRGKVWYSQGTESTTRNRIQAATLMACRFDMSGTAAIYGPSGTTPSKVSGGGVNGYIQRPNWSGGTAPALWTLLGFADEESMLMAFATNRGGWDARRVLNRVFPEFGFNTLSATNATAANQASADN